MVKSLRALVFFERLVSMALSGGLGSVRLTVGLNNLRGLFQPQ